ncbi:hypothetical protein [Methylobacterium sp. J-070]|uniref:hypothetical protein n=1 Tax=Methylobacterium sp. J-070 TaxID=2836650 RepID=UPI001FB8E3EA|nr:hypothetical protein [Methylobacterium sp. J-070]MCJ2054680.1 hypothetical protein [Methylobacterium sp. J-070]
MTAEPTSPEGLREVLRLCTVLADCVLDAEIMGQQVPVEQAAALAKAARLLQDHGVEWPPLLTQALHELAGKIGQGVADGEAVQDASDALPDVDLHGLTRFFASYRKEKDQP